MDWCGGQPGGDRGGALAAEDKWPLCATFGEVKGGKGREEAANKGCLCPPSTPALFNYYNSCNDLVQAPCEMEGNLSEEHKVLFDLTAL